MSDSQFICRRYDSMDHGYWFRCGGQASESLSVGGMIQR
jgi:hypothetical protein